MTDRAKQAVERYRENPEGYVLPDGEYVTVDELEARLKAAVKSSQSPEELEEAQFKLASFYLEEARPLQAYPILVAIHGSTSNEERKNRCTRWLGVILGGRKRPPTERAKENYAAMLIQLGIAFAYGGPITAWNYFTKAVALTERPETKALCYLKMGALCEQSREYQAAADNYSKAFTLPQEENELWYFLNNNLGYSLNQAGRHTEAEQYCRKAISVNPLLYNAHKNLGLSLRGQGKYREAVASLLEAGKLAPGEQRAMGHLEEMFECRPELYKQIFGIKKGGLEALRKAIFDNSQESVH